MASGPVPFHLATDDRSPAPGSSSVVANVSLWHPPHRCLAASRCLASIPRLRSLDAPPSPALGSCTGTRDRPETDLPCCLTDRGSGTTIVCLPHTPTNIRQRVAPRPRCRSPTPEGRHVRTCFDRMPGNTAQQPKAPCRDVYVRRGSSADTCNVQIDIIYGRGSINRFRHLRTTILCADLNWKPY